MKDEVWEVEKGLECHGWVMGHAWGSHGEHGRWVIGPKHYMFWWDMFQGSSCPAIKMHAGPPAKTWHVSSEWQVLRFMTCRWNNVRVKIYVAAMEAPRKKGKTGWNLVCHQNWWFWWVWSPIECQCTFFGRFLLNLTLCMMTKLRVLVLYFSYFMDKLYYGVLSLKLSDHLRSWYWVQVWIFSRYIYIYIPDILRLYY